MHFLQLQCSTAWRGAGPAVGFNLSSFPFSVHNNIPKGSEPAWSLRPKAGAGGAEFCLYQEPEGNRELLGAVHWPHSVLAERCGSDHTLSLEPPPAPRELMPVHTCSTEIYGEVVTQKWSCL